LNKVFFRIIVFNFILHRPLYAAPLSNPDSKSTISRQFFCKRKKKIKKIRPDGQLALSVIIGQSNNLSCRSTL